jgi:DNA-binding NarL/FixJ family response regulator
MNRVLLIDDHVVVRTGYRRLLDAEPDLKVVGEAASAEEANALVQCTEPDVALVDLSLKGSSGIEAIGGMLARRPELKILVLSMHDSAGHITQALRAGALGYMTKYSDPEAVIAGIRRVATGRRAYSPEVAEVLAREQHTGDCPLSGLTPREFEVLRLLVHGETPIGIASSMHLSRKTILNYLSMIRQKLDTDTDFQLLHLAARHGLLEARSLAS